MISALMTGALRSGGFLCSTRRRCRASPRRVISWMNAHAAARRESRQTPGTICRPKNGRRTRSRFVVETVTARPPGVPLMRDRDKPDETILALPSHDPHRMEYFDIADIPQHLLREIAYSFATYKTLEGKQVEILGWELM
jgi:hypothetical protein